MTVQFDTVVGLTSLSCNCSVVLFLRVRTIRLFGSPGRLSPISALALVSTEDSRLGKAAEILGARRSFQKKYYLSPPTQNPTLSTIKPTMKLLYPFFAAITAQVSAEVYFKEQFNDDVSYAIELFLEVNFC